jgi:hypothetical protein
MSGRVVGVDVPQSGFAFVASPPGCRAGQGDYRSVWDRPLGALRHDGGRATTVLNAGNELRRASGCAVSTVAGIGPYLGTVMAALPADDPSRRNVWRGGDRYRPRHRPPMRRGDCEPRDGCSGWRT